MPLGFRMTRECSYLCCLMTERPALGRLATAAVRARPRLDAALTSQLLFGEPVLLLQNLGEYQRVRCPEDGFEGFVRTDQLLAVPEDVFVAQLSRPAFNLDLFSMLRGPQQGVPITFGARLADFDGLRLQHGGQYFEYSGQAALTDDITASADTLLRLAYKWLYVPGMHGGRTPMGVDPVAFVQLVYRILNLRLPRRADAMVERGELVDFVVQAQVGDVAFFDNAKRKIEHVGLLLPDSKILHVGDRVRVDALDHYGIFNYDLGRYTHRLRVVKRVLAGDNPGVAVQSQKQRSAAESSNQLAIF